MCIVLLALAWSHSQATKVGRPGNEASIVVCRAEELSYKAQVEKVC